MDFLNLAEAVAVSTTPSVTEAFVLFLSIVWGATVLGIARHMAPQLDVTCSLLWCQDGNYALELFVR